MFDKFTNKTQEAIISAQMIAQDYGQQQIEAIHVLASLLLQNESLVKPVLEKLSINPIIIQEQIFKTIEKLPKVFVSSPVGTVQGTAEVAMILERAKQEATKLSDEFISTEHIFLALISIKSKAQNILINAKVEYEKVLKILAELRGNQRITDPEPESKFQVLKK
ncbi:type VI secretion system ATPase TssH, partial [Patescibacteria group bacterium]|nr:type VI secretion system ATPase TssH [Patescibacteria group bacterium]